MLLSINQAFPQKRLHIHRLGGVGGLDGGEEQGGALDVILQVVGGLRAAAQPVAE
jgi:hypothetical protein